MLPLSWRKYIANYYISRTLWTLAVNIKVVGKAGREWEWKTGPLAETKKSRLSTSSYSYVQHTYIMQLWVYLKFCQVFFKILRWSRSFYSKFRITCRYTSWWANYVHWSRTFQRIYFEHTFTIIYNHPTFPRLSNMYLWYTFDQCFFRGDICHNML